MEYLKAGGRIGKVAGAAGALLGIKPIITLKEGEIFPSGIGRVRKKTKMCIRDRVREVCHKLPNTIVTTHMSHCYPQGANLYFIFITRMDDAEKFRAYHSTILDAIQKSGAAMSHHHGIGKMFAPWLEGQLGRTEYGVLCALKNYFDPDYCMNPGGTLGFDVPEEEKRFLKE